MKEGLFGKYIISKADGSDVDSNARCFVLRYDTDPHAKEAVHAYADSIQNDNPELAQDLWDALEEVEPRR